MISDSKLRAALGLDKIDPTPTLLAAMRDRALAYIETQTGRYFGPVESVSEFVRGSGGRFIQLGNPLATITGVVERPHPGGTETALVELVSGVGDWQVRRGSNSAYLTRMGTDVIWAAGYEYEVTYQRGYVVDHGPKDIEALLIALVGLTYNTAGREGLSSETIGGYSYSRPGIHTIEDGDLRSIPGALQTIRQWRRLVMA